MVHSVKPESLYPEIIYQATRSSGAGGQHVNKVNTKVELRFDLSGSAILDPEQKQFLLQRLSPYLTREGTLIITSQKSRSQYRNKQNCLEKFNDMIFTAFIPVKKRIATQPRFSSKIRRLEGKRIQSLKKQNRKRPDH